MADGGGIQIGGEEKILLSHGYDEVFSFFCSRQGPFNNYVDKKRPRPGGG